MIITSSKKVDKMQQIQIVKNTYRAIGDTNTVKL